MRVYAGVDPLTKKRHDLVETVPAGPHAEREAEKARTRLLNQVDESRNPRTKATVRQLINKYLEVANLDPSTRRGYQRNFHNHVAPLFGDQPVGKIDAQILDSFYAELARCRAHCDGKRRTAHRTAATHACDHRCNLHKCEPLAPSSIRRIHFLLSGAFTRALRWGWITINPATMAQPPPEPTPTPEPPTPAEAARILSAAREDPDWHTFLWTAMTTGARRAELCALRWRHVDLASATLKVKKSIDQNGAETAEKDTKTHQHRRIALDPVTVKLLREHKTRTEEVASSLGLQLSVDSYVFARTPDGQFPTKPDTITQRYGRLVARLGIKTTVHKLRHYSATELITAGVDARTVGGRLGHAGGGNTTLRVYAAWVAESDQRAATSLSSRMPASSSEPFDRTQYAKSEPRTAPERIAGTIRAKILSGELPPGSHAPSQKEIASDNHVSADVAHRTMKLLRSWGCVETSNYRRGVILAPPDAAERYPESEHFPHKSTSDLDTENVSRSHEFRLLCLNETVRVFTAEADPSQPEQLKRLLRNAVRRRGGTNANLADYELEVRDLRSSELITSFVAM